MDFSRFQAHTNLLILRAQQESVYKSKVPLVPLPHSLILNNWSLRDCSEIARGLQDYSAGKKLITSGQWARFGRSG